MPDQPLNGSQTLSELIPSATEIMRCISQIEREKRYLQRLLNIIRDRAKDRADGKENHIISDLLPNATKVIKRIEEIKREKRYLQRLLRINRDQAIDRIKNQSNLQKPMHN